MAGERKYPISTTRDAPPVKKTVSLCGILGGVLIAVLKVIEYRFLVLEHSLEIYGGIVALLFATLGIWFGLNLTRTRETMAAGLSNREIAERLFVSENTVKTHAARWFAKLSARRRTQAVQLAKTAGLIP